MRRASGTAKRASLARHDAAARKALAVSAGNAGRDGCSRGNLLVGERQPTSEGVSDKSEGIGVQDIWLEFRDAHNQNICVTGYPTEKNPALCVASSKHRRIQAT